MNIDKPIITLNGNRKLILIQIKKNISPPYRIVIIFIS